MTGLRSGAALASRNLAEECAKFPPPRTTKREMREFMAKIASHLRFVADLLDPPNLTAETR